MDRKINFLEVLDYLRTELEKEKKTTEDNPEIKESAEYNIKVLEEMIFELEQAQSNRNNPILLQNIDRKISIISTLLYVCFGMLIALLIK